MLKLLRFRLNNLHIVYVCFRFFFSHRDWLLLLDFLCFNFLYCYSIPFDISPYLACAIPAILFTLRSFRCVIPRDSLWSFFLILKDFYLPLILWSSISILLSSSFLFSSVPASLFLSNFSISRAANVFTSSFLYRSSLHQFSSSDFVTRYD